MGTNHGDRLLGLDADQSLQWVLEHLVERFPTYDALICTGDLSNEAGTEAFLRIKESLANLPHKTPMVWLPGNHDDNDELKAVSASRVNLENDPMFMQTLQLGSWLLSFYDSTIPKKVPGLLSSNELKRMKQTLSQEPEMNHAFFMHHPSLIVGTDWIDPQRIQNADKLIRIAEKNPHLKLVGTGHIHQDFSAPLSSKAQTITYSSPATSIQFKPNCSDFALDNKMPGFRWFKLHDDGSFESGVERISERDLGIDQDADGYLI